MRYNKKEISIHTPHTRCDTLQMIFLFKTKCNFNPHTSYEVWQDLELQMQALGQISIHTPHTRCDPNAENRRSVRPYFNPHTSYEVWLNFVRISNASRDISIHTPHTRCDRNCPLYHLFFFGCISIHTPHTRCDVGDLKVQQFLRVISIHTPHTRCDYRQKRHWEKQVLYFNPHTSYEVWLY